MIEDITLNGKTIYQLEVPKYNKKMYCFLGEEKNYREENYSDLELVSINNKNFVLYYRMTSSMYYKSENCYISKSKADEEKHRRIEKYYFKSDMVVKE
jgi:hypothetical protein